MAIVPRYPAVLEIDIVLAGVDPETAVPLTIPNPEGRDLVVSAAVILCTQDHTALAEQTLFVSTGFDLITLVIAGPDQRRAKRNASSDIAFYWGAGDSMIFELGAGPAIESYVGKLYVEYWGGDPPRDYMGRSTQAD